MWPESVTDFTVEDIYFAITFTLEALAKHLVNENSGLSVCFLESTVSAHQQLGTCCHPPGRRRRPGGAFAPPLKAGHYLSSVSSGMKRATCSYEEHFLSLWAARPRKPIHGLLLEVNCAHFQSVCLKKKRSLLMC